MQNKIFFMPFDPKHPGYLSAQFEYGKMGGGFDKNQIQIDHELAKGHKAFSAWWSPKKKDPFVSSLNTGQIYIRGHGMPGFKSIEGGRGGERVDYDEVVDRLIGAGLNKNFSGDIKCYNCHSAEHGDPDSTDPEAVGGIPFAQRVADELVGRGYRGCRIFGYYGSIDSFVKDGSEGTHKYVRRRETTGTTTKQVEGGRASEARYEFFGRMKPKKPNIFKRMFN